MSWVNFQLFSRENRHLIHSDGKYFLRAEDVFAHMIGDIRPELRDEFVFAIQKFETTLFELLNKNHLYLANKAARSFNSANNIFHTLVTELMDDSVNNPFIGDLRRILILSDIAEWLPDPDWEVDRDDVAHSISLGIRSQKDMTRMISQRIRNHQWRIVDIKKFLAVSYGPGNGKNMIELQTNSDPASVKMVWEEVLPDSTTVQDAWDFVWVCNKFYFPIIWLVEKFLRKPELVANKTLCHFLVTQIQYLCKAKKLPKKYILSTGKINIETLPQLLTDKEVVSLLIPNELLEKWEYRYDGEFADGKNLRHIDDTFAELLRKYKEHPDSFIQDIFTPDFQWKKLLEQAPFYFRNIYVADFSEIDTLFPDKQIIHYGSSVRWTSHVDNDIYKKVISDTVRRIAPGGIYIDDGIRRSYSREIRIDEVNEVLQKYRDPTLRAYLIRNNDSSIVSVIFERGIENIDWSIDFFPRADLEWNLLEGCSLEQVWDSNQFQIWHRVQSIRNTVMRVVLWPYRNEDQYYTLLQNLHHTHAVIDEAVSLGNTLPEIIQVAERTTSILLWRLQHTEEEILV